MSQLPILNGPLIPPEIEYIPPEMESNPPVFGPPPFGQPPVFGPPGGQVPGGINYQNPFEFTDAINPYPDPLVGINPFPTIDPGANPFAPPTDDPYALPEQNPFPAIQPNPYLPPMPFETPPINNTPFPEFAPVTFEPPPELPQGGFDPYQPVSGGPTTDPYGGTLGQGGGGPAAGGPDDTMYGGGSSDFDETIVTNPPPPPPPPEGSPYFMVDGERFNDRNAAIARARSLGDPGGLELFAADGTLISGRPQYTAEEREEQQRLAAERRAEFEARQQRNRQRTSYWNDLIETQEQAQQNVNPNDFYYIDSPRLGKLKFASFDDAKSFLEDFNTGGDENITDVYDRSQRSGLPQSFGSIKSSGGNKTLYQFANTDDRHGESFDSREEAANYIRNQEVAKRRQRAVSMINFDNRNNYKPDDPRYRDLSDYDLSTEEGFNKLKRRVGAGKAGIIKNLLDTDRLEDQINRRLDGESAATTGVGTGLRIRQFAEGGEVSNRLRISDIKRFKRGGAVGTFVERR